MDKKQKKVLRSFMMISQIGINMMVSMFLCVAIGLWLNRLLHTQIAFPVMLVIGIFAAFRNVYVLTKSFYSEDMKKEHEQLAYIASLKNYRKEHPEEYEQSKTVSERDVTGHCDLGNDRTGPDDRNG